MALTLKLRSGDIEPLPELHFDAPRIVVGRAHGSDLQLPDPSVSPRHASFRERGSDYVLVDEGSDNGTFCGTSRLTRQAPQTVSDGDLLRFGRIWVEVRIGPCAGAGDSGKARELARELVEHALEQDGPPDARSQSHGMLVMLDAGSTSPAPLCLSKPRHAYVVGSQKSAALRLEDPDLPGRCLELRRQADQLWVTALCEEPQASLEGGIALEKGERTLWPRGAVLSLGERRLRFVDRTGQLLEQLERGPTERIANDASIDPPRGGPLPSEAETGTPDDTWAGDDAATGTTTPARASGHTRRWASNPGRERWTSGDALVFMLAVSVLGLSLWAIRWLAHVGA